MGRFRMLLVGDHNLLGAWGDRMTIAGAPTPVNDGYDHQEQEVLMELVARCIRRRTDVLRDFHVGRGSERLAVNELLLSSRWRETRRWRWRGPGHITLLESRVVTNWVRGLLLQGVFDTRVVGIADSRTSLGSALKGRPASRAIRRTLQLTNPLILAGGLQVSMLFGPTRLNVADDPTRHLEVREPWREPPLWMRDLDTFWWVCSRPRCPAPSRRGAESS